MNILILGATGFIGSAILQKLAADGHQITGLGRNPEKARLKWPAARWLKVDISALSAREWAALIDGQDIVVNCAGALQDGLSDDLVATQQNAMLALYDAAKAAGGRLIVQISARTGGSAASLAFLSTKRRADEALATSGLAFVILRPALVIGRNAHGGTEDPKLIAHTASTVVIADTVFTATAVVLQPITGYLLARNVGWSLTEGWIALSLLLYVVTGLFWLPVVWIQIRLRDIARLADAEASPLPPEWHRLYRIWFACGFPAFFAVIGIFWLMLAKPDIRLF